jgi:dihydropteroate synthase
VPVIQGLVAETDAPISIDTMKADVAAAALAAGATILNDVSALTHDAGMVQTARDGAAGIVLMHMRGRPRTMQDAPEYDDVTAEVCAYLSGRVAALQGAGIAREALCVDPGIGFGKTVAHNLRLLQDLPRLTSLGCPVLVGLSRKRFLGHLTGRAVDDRLVPSVAALLHCARCGVHVMRVHDVRESADALKVISALSMH